MCTWSAVGFVDDLLIGDVMDLKLKVGVGNKVRVSSGLQSMGSQRAGHD